MSRRIGVVTVGRSDWGHLREVLRALAATPELEPVVIAAGAHLLPRFGETVREIEAEGWPPAARVEIPLDADSPEAIARATGAAVGGFAQAYARLRPDLLLVLGDRFEVLAAAIAALPLNLPVAHLHGGEVTEAAMDEQIRHAVTKLSHLHLAAAEPYAARIRQMGEEPWRVHCVGAPGLDRLHRLAALPRAELARRVGLPLDGPLIVATLHPVTLEHEDTGAHAEEFAAALSGAPGDLVLTHPNADTAHRTIAARLERLAAERPRTRLVAALGDDVYCSLLREADCLVGNSSSGLIEAPSFALPAVNVGPRQRGRLRARSVIDVGHGRAEIAEGLRRALSREFRGGLAGLANPYGDGRSAPRIAAALAGVELGRRLLVKRFVDRPGPPA